jgi:CelD/BcsL family acetyltransferase involved in cellulose biosynthesis
MKMNTDWKINIYSSWNDVDDKSFILYWQEIINNAKNAHVFYHPTLIKAWTDTYRKIRDITPIYCVGEKNDVKVFIPLIIWKRNWKNAFIRMLIPAGYSDYDYHDPIVTDKVNKKDIYLFWENLNEIIKTLGNRYQYDRFELNGLREYSITATAKKETEICPYCNFKEYYGFDDFLNKMRKSLRGDILRQQRRLIELGDLKYIVFDENNIEEALKELPDMLDNHSKRWPNSYKPPGFHDTIIREGLKNKIVHLSVIRIKNKTISWHLGFSYNKHYYYYMPSFLSSYSKYSPSKIHLAMLTKECFEKGIEVFDHLRGNENYKNGWANEYFTLYEIYKTEDNVGSKMRLKLQSILHS